MPLIVYWKPVKFEPKILAVKIPPMNSLWLLLQIYINLAACEYCVIVKTYAWCRIHKKQTRKTNTKREKKKHTIKPNRLCTILWSLTYKRDKITMSIMLNFPCHSKWIPINLISLVQIQQVILQFKTKQRILNSKLCRWKRRKRKYFYYDKKKSIFANIFEISFIH